MNRDLIIGLDLGGTKSAATLITPAGEVRYRVSGPTPASGGADAVVPFLIGLVKQVAAEAPAFGTVIGCGISAGAPADAARGLVFPAPNLLGWPDKGTPLPSIVSNALDGIPTYVENDADATALAEWRFGAGQGTETMAFLTVGTGIGSGLILNGHLHRGAFGAGGEIGHVAVVTENGRQCNCGLTGCLEAYSSGPSVIRIAQEHGYTGEPNGASVATAARAGDPAARFAFTQASTMLGRGLAILTMLLNPERFVLGTLAVHAGDLLIPGTIDALNAHSWSRLTDKVTVVPAALGDRAQDLAALCAFLARASETSGTMHP